MELKKELLEYYDKLEAKGEHNMNGEELGDYLDLYCILHHDFKANEKMKERIITNAEKYNKKEKE